MPSFRLLIQLRSSHIWVYLLVSTLILAFGCSREEKKETGLLADSLANALLKNIRRPKSEAIALLAIKYGLSSGMVDTIVSDYLAQCDFANEGLIESLKEGSTSSQAQKDSAILRFMGFPEPQEYTHAITLIADRNRTEPKTVAALIYDYRVWHNLDVASGR